MLSTATYDRLVYRLRTLSATYQLLPNFANKYVAASSEICLLVVEQLRAHRDRLRVFGSGFIARWLVLDDHIVRRRGRFDLDYVARIQFRHGFRVLKTRNSIFQETVSLTISTPSSDLSKSFTRVHPSSLASAFSRSVGGGANILKFYCALLWHGTHPSITESISTRYIIFLQLTLR